MCQNEARVEYFPDRVPGAPWFVTFLYGERVRYFCSASRESAMASCRLRGLVVIYCDED